MPFSPQRPLTGPDYFMLIGYFVLMLGIGVYFYRYMRGMKDYFSGGNTIPWWLSGISFYMTQLQRVRVRHLFGAVLSSTAGCGVTLFG